ncbi:MAG: hypothetical protein JWP12_1760 [Bacteroidetes bacterium]|nr:hypothetical protein [Bacteroidota bacterium]
MFTNNIVIPGLTRDLLNTCSAYTVLNWQIPGQARDDNIICEHCKKTTFYYNIT